MRKASDRDFKNSYSSCALSHHSPSPAPSLIVDSLDEQGTPRLKLSLNSLSVIL